MASPSPSDLKPLSPASESPTPSSYHSPAEESEDLSLVDALLSLRLVGAPVDSTIILDDAGTNPAESIKREEGLEEIQIKQQTISLNTSSPPFDPVPKPPSTSPQYISTSMEILPPKQGRTKAKTAVILQEACLKHVYSRNNDIGTIVERPQRIRAVKMGVAGCLARMEGRERRKASRQRNETDQKGEDEEDSKRLDILMSGMDIGEKVDVKGKGREILGGPFDIIESTRLLSIDDPALLYIHGRPHDSSGYTHYALPTTSPTKSPSKASTSTAVQLPAVCIPYAAELQNWCRASSVTMRSAPNYSEVPMHLNQGDLYLIEGSEQAILGSVGAVCDGIDLVLRQDGQVHSEDVPMESAYEKVFVAIRPPGHHCSDSDPSGFCWVNNVAVGAAYAHQKYNVDRVIIFDIDLHHGNGTQEIAWRINSLANQAKKLIPERSNSPRKGSPKKETSQGEKKRDLQICYTSLHDISSYPCEDGDPTLVQAASINIDGGHSQYIANIHLEPFETEAEFHKKLYERYRNGLLGAAKCFCDKTSSIGGSSAKEGERTLIFISAGFDASEHEGQGMSRHCTNVPTSFYHRFSIDVAHFAKTYSNNKVVAVLEGGYSDRALASGTLAMLVGLVDEKSEAGKEAEGWWKLKELEKLEKACAPPVIAPTIQRRGKVFTGATFSSAASDAMSKEDEEWIPRTIEIYNRLEGIDPSLITPKSTPPLTARERRVGATSTATEVGRTMQLRERRARGEEITPTASPVVSKVSIRTKKVAVSTPVATSTAEELTLVVKEEGKLVVEETKKIRFTWKEGGI